MRTSLLRLGAVALVACGTLSAQNLRVVHTNPSTKGLLNVGAAITQQPVPLKATKVAGDETQALTYTRMWYTDFYPSFESYTSNKVFLYDPGTNGLFIVRNNRTFTEAGALEGGQVRVYASTDNGSNWTETEVLNTPGSVFALPNFAVVNQGVTSVADLNWTIYGWTYDQSNQYRRTSQAGIFKTSGDPFSFVMEGPDEPGGNGYNWNAGDMIGVAGDAPAVYHAGLLGNGTSGQYGTYGVWGFDYVNEDFVTSRIPSSWDVTQFRPSGNPDQSYNSAMRIGADVDGRLYAVVNNLFADNQNTRIPAVSMSEDQGTTWSAFNRMPQSAFDAYMTQYGWDNITIYRPYDMEAFVVTGVNQFSYFFRVARVANNNVANLDIVEASYRNGAWTLNRVAELNGFPLEFARQDTASDLIGEFAWVPYFTLTSQGHEIEAALTADGKDILVKWIDENPSLGYVKFSSPLTLYFENQSNTATQLDSMLTTDVYYAHRPVSGTTWSAPVNVTNDMAYDHGTRIPPVIPGLNRVPFLTLNTIAKQDYNTQYPYLPAIQQLPDIVLDASVDYRTPNMLQYAWFDATTTSVEEEAETFNFRFNAVSPNPASNEAEVAFTTDAASKVMVEVFSTNGTRMATVLNSELGAGIHALTIDASNYASGTYYVALTVGGQRLTQPLVIVK